MAAIRASARRLPAPLDVVLAVAFCAWVASSALLTGAFSDWELEAQPPLLALAAGDASGWAGALPAYAGGMTLRAPGMLLGHALGGGDLDWAFRVDAAPALAALAGLGVLLAGAARRAGAGTFAIVLLVGLVAGGPFAARALEVGHPEEVLGGVLCVAALCVAGRRPGTEGRGTGGPLLAGALAGVAVANKPWAVLLVVPVLALLPGGRERLLALLAAGLAGALVLAPSTLLGTAHVGAVAATGDAAIFKPAQVFWFLGEPGYAQPSPFGPIPGRRAGPAWTGVVSHPLIVVAGVLLAAWWWRRHPHGDRDAAVGLVLVAAILWWRCLLDTWNADYYLAPALLCLVAAAALRGRPPWLAAAATALATVTMLLPDRLGMGDDAHTVAHLVWAVPFGVLLVAEALRRPAPSRTSAVAPGPGGRPSPTVGTPVLADGWAAGTPRAYARDM